MTATVEVDILLQRYKFSHVASGRGLSLLLEEAIQVVDVGAMVSAVMVVDDLTRHDWLEGTHLVRQGFELDASDSTNDASAQFLLD